MFDARRDGLGVRICCLSLIAVFGYAWIIISLKNFKVLALSYRQRLWL